MAGQDKTGVNCLSSYVNLPLVAVNRVDSISNACGGTTCLKYGGASGFVNAVIIRNAPR